MTPCCDLPTFREMEKGCDESRQNITRWVAQKIFCLALEYILLLWWVAPKYYPMSRAKNISFGFRIFSPSCAYGDSSRKYNFWLYLKICSRECALGESRQNSTYESRRNIICLALEYVLPHVFMVTRANIIFGCIWHIFFKMCPSWIASKQRPVLRALLRYVPKAHGSKV